MALAIGFATEYYTLWDICSEKQYDSRGFMTGTKHHFWYQKNISKDVKKVEEQYPGIEINMDLRGISRSFERFERVEYPVDCFSFGIKSGVPIMECSDVWQLERALTQEKGKRRKVLARRRLIQLGELVRYPHFETKEINVDWGKRDDRGNCLPERLEEIKCRVSYASPFFVQREEARKKQAEQTYLFNEGEKVTLSIKEVSRFGFETQYGYTFVRVYETDDGKTVKYVGSSPKDLKDGFNAITATIKHKEFRGNKETHLLRIKLI